jgi:hypothetical protein
MSSSGQTHNYLENDIAGMFNGLLEDSKVISANITSKTIYFSNAENLEKINAAVKEVMGQAWRAVAG